jgi:hypothetical protein
MAGPELVPVSGRGQPGPGGEQPPEGGRVGVADLAHGAGDGVLGRLEQSLGGVRDARGGRFADAAGLRPPLLERPADLPRRPHLEPGNHQRVDPLGPGPGRQRDAPAVTTSAASRAVTVTRNRSCRAIRLAKGPGSSSARAPAPSSARSRPASPARSRAGCGRWRGWPTARAAVPPSACASPAKLRAPDGAGGVRAGPGPVPAVAALGDRFVPRVLPDDAAGTDVPPFFARHVPGPHSVVTVHLIDQAGQPTVAARDEILAFLKARLKSDFSSAQEPLT